MLWNLSRTIVTSSLLMLAGVPVLAEDLADGQLPVVQGRDLARAAGLVPVGGRLMLEDVRVVDTGEPVALVLQRFQVFAADAVITVHGDEGDEVLPAPDNAYFRGEVAGRPGSLVFLAVLEDGTAQGFVSEGGESYLVAPRQEPRQENDGGVLEMHRVSPADLKASQGSGFTCGNDKIPPALNGALEGLDLAAVEGAREDRASTTVAGLPAYTARVAIETDFEFYQKFNNSTNATNYIAGLIGYASTIYSAEINTSLAVQSVSLWTTSNDPWNQTTTACSLLEFGNYWNVNRTNVSRTIAHFMSGKANGGGIAWLGVLCSGSFTTSQAQLGVSCPGLAASGSFGGGYGYTGNMTGTFNPNAPTVMWDIMAVSHEIGHNFNSPHTHCYGNLGGNPNPIDQCYAGECGGPGCNCNSATLPGAAGTGSGTIMSYCHLLGGNFGNISLNFGTNHPFGVQPGREASRMSSYVVSTATANASCLAPATPANGIFADGLEIGNTSLWQ
jgi:hypothetical protein